MCVHGSFFFFSFVFLFLLSFSLAPPPVLYFDPGRFGENQNQNEYNNLFFVDEIQLTFKSK